MKQASRLERLCNAWVRSGRSVAEFRFSNLRHHVAKRRLAASLAGTAILTAASLLLAGGRDGGPPASESGFIVQAAMRGDLDVKVTASGTVEPVRIVEVSTELSGTIREIAVDYNDKVKAGQLLASLDDAVPARQLARARAALRLAEARLREGRISLSLAESERTRKQRLAERQAVSERELEAAVAAFNKAASSIDMLEAELAIAMAEVDLAASNHAKTRIVSPIDGVVLRRNVERGQVIAASLQSPVLFRIAADLKHMQVKVDVDEADALAVKPGQPAAFRGHGMHERSVRAVVEKIYLGPEIVQGVVTYKAILGFDNDELQLKPGMTATTEMTVAQRRNVLLVPNAALRFAPPAGALAAHSTPDSIARIISAASPQPAAAASGPTEARQPNLRQVHKLARGTLMLVNVRTGETDGAFTEILQGDIAPGDSIVVDTSGSRE